MLEEFSLWCVLTVVRSGLLIAGICALAVWAARQPDQGSEFLKKLTERDSKCAGD